MKKILYSYRIHGLIEVPDDATDEEIERLALSHMVNEYVCDGTLDWIETKREC